MRIVRPEIGDVAGQHDVARVPQRQDDSRIREKPANRREAVHRQRVLVDQQLAGLERGQRPRDLEIGVARSLDVLVGRGGYRLEAAERFGRVA